MKTKTITSTLLILLLQHHAFASGSIPAPAGESSIGLALAGGSIRAASACYGVLRGFQQKEVSSPTGEGTVPAMDRVQYNSGISGGSIPAILYTYAQVSTKDLLETDRDYDPTKITLELLNDMPKTSMGYAMARKPKTRLIMLRWMLKVLSNPLNIFKAHSLWTAGVIKKFLKPLNIPPNKFFTSGKEELQKILRDNPKLREKDFLLPRDGVKTLPMILFTMFGSRADNHEYFKKNQKIYDEAWDCYMEQETLAIAANPSEFIRPNITEIILSFRDEKRYDGNLVMPYVSTPDAVETRFEGKVLVRKNKVDFPEKPSRPFEWGSPRGRFGRKRRFSVETLMAFSTNFPGSSGSFIPGLFFTGLRKIQLSDGSSVTQKFADGGSNDLMGIMPLIQHETKNIIAIYDFNQNPPHTDFTQKYADIYKFANATSTSDPDFDIHFQEWLKRFNPRISCYFGFFGKRPIQHANILNHAFEDPKLDRLKELMVKLNSLFKAGEPLIATLKDLKVVDNPFWGIKGGKTVDLTLMYFNMPKKFSDQVNIEAVTPPAGESKVNEHGQFNNEEMKNVPELPVHGTDPLKYTNGQVNMMGYLGSWMVHHSWDGLVGHDGKVVFDGFGKIFGE